MVKTWFQQKGFGDSNARLMAMTCVMVASKQVPGPPGASPAKAKKKAPQAPELIRKPPESQDTEMPHKVQAREPSAPREKSDSGPETCLWVVIG